MPVYNYSVALRKAVTAFGISFFTQLTSLGGVPNSVQDFFFPVCVAALAFFFTIEKQEAGLAAAAPKEAKDAMSKIKSLVVFP